jgi:hypothetical protein
MSFATVAISRLRTLSRRASQKPPLRTGPLMEPLEPRVMLSATLWTGQFGSTVADFGESVAVNVSGAYVCGYTNGDMDGSNAGAADIFLTKYLTSGSKSWTKQIGTTSDDFADAVIADSAGDAYIAGYTYGTLGATHIGGADALVIKINSAGTTKWTTQFGTSNEDYVTDIALDGTGNTYVCGYTFGSLGGASAGGYDAFVAKLDSSGAILWTRQMGTSMFDRASGIAVDDSNNVYITGETFGDLRGTNKGGPDAFVAKFNSSGTRQWTKQFGTRQADYGKSIAVTSSGTMFIGGETNGNLAGHIGQTDAFVRKLNTSGNTLWTRQLGTSQDDFGEGISLGGSGGAYLAGTTRGSIVGTNAGSTDAFLTRLSSSGGVLWSRQIGTSTYDQANSVAVNSVGDAYVTGYTGGSLEGQPHLGNYDAFLAKFTPDTDLYDRFRAASLGSIGNTPVVTHGKIGWTATNQDTNDWYKFTITGRRTITVTLTGLSKNANVQLCDNGGTPIKTGNKSGTNNESLTYRVGTVGSGAVSSYSVRVYSNSKTKTNYTLTLKAKSDAEKNGWQRAKSLGTPGETPTAYIGTFGGVDTADWYKFKVKGVKVVKLQVDKVDDVTAGTMTLYGVSGGTPNLFKMSTPMTTPGNGNIPVGPGTYYIRCETDMTPKASYRLRVTSQGDADFAKRGQAKNMGPVTAVTKTYDGIAGMEDRNDWFRFVIHGTRNTTLTLTNLTNNLDLRLYSGTGNLMNTSASGGTGDEQIVRTLNAGTYYARVFVPSGTLVTSLAGYSLKLIALSV